MPEPILLRLGKKSALWAELTPHGRGTSQTWDFQISTRGRGAKVIAVVLGTAVTRPLVTVTLGRETYGLHIHTAKAIRGGGFAIGGTRKVAISADPLQWEMRWIPLDGLIDSFDIELRLKLHSKLRAEVTVSLPSPMVALSHWSDSGASESGLSATVSWSSYSKIAVGVVTSLDGQSVSAYDEDAKCLTLNRTGFPLGGIKPLRLSLHIDQSADFDLACDGLQRHLASVAETHLPSASRVAHIEPSIAAMRLIEPEYGIRAGTQRIYLAMPEFGNANEAVYGGAPYYPLEALVEGWNFNLFVKNDCIIRLVRFGSLGIASDFQVMGSSDGQEPNKGAFWDLKRGGEAECFNGRPEHSIASNARIAVAFFHLANLTAEGLCKQSAINACQWLLLKQNEQGYYSSATILGGDSAGTAGKPGSLPCDTEGAEAIAAYVMAFRATNSEVWIKSAWKIATHLIERYSSGYAELSILALSQLITGFAYLDAESPNLKLRAPLRSWSEALRVRIMTAERASSAPNIAALPDELGDNDDDAQESADVVELSCPFDWSDNMELVFGIDALVRMFLIERDPKLLRAAFLCLSRCHAFFLRDAWPAMKLWRTMLLSLVGMVPDSTAQFDSLTVVVGWRKFEPDAMVTPYVKVTTLAGTGNMMAMPLVCRATGQLLVLVLGEGDVESVNIGRNGKCCIMRDVIKGTIEDVAELHFLPGGRWGRYGIFIIER